MIVIGHNVECEIEDEKLIIVCDLKNIKPSVSVKHQRYVFATTHGVVDVPLIKMRLELTLYGEKVVIQE